MRTHAESAVRLARPILQIVPAFKARPPPIGDLVMQVSCVSEPLCRCHVETCEDIVIGKIGGSFAPSATLFRIEHIDRETYPLTCVAVRHFPDLHREKTARRD